jgi:hypothetical protein
MMIGVEHKKNGRPATGGREVEPAGVYPPAPRMHSVLVPHLEPILEQLRQREGGAVLWPEVRARLAQSLRPATGGGGWREALLADLIADSRLYGVLEWACELGLLRCREVGGLVVVEMTGGRR